jgi:hypothetical protein
MQRLLEFDVMAITVPPFSVVAVIVVINSPALALVLPFGGLSSFCFGEFVEAEQRLPRLGRWHSGLECVSVG